MTDRERLIELLVKSTQKCDSTDCNGCKYWNTNDCGAARMADHILSDGWIRPPCKVGDTVYVLYPQIKYIEKYYVTGIILGDKNDTIQFKYGAVFTIWEKKYDEYFGKTIFFTRKEAEQALAERGGTNADR